MSRDAQRYFDSDFRNRDKVVYMCLNAECFYCETIMDVNDLVWKETWDSNIEDLAAYPTCPSCGEVSWREVHDNEPDLVGLMKE